MYRQDNPYRNAQIAAGINTGRLIAINTATLLILMHISNVSAIRMTAPKTDQHIKNPIM